jgi:hypothetical protein
MNRELVPRDLAGIIPRLIALIEIALVPRDGCFKQQQLWHREPPRMVTHTVVEYNNVP